MAFTACFSSLSVSIVRGDRNELRWHLRGTDDNLSVNIIKSYTKVSQRMCGYFCLTTTGCFGFDFTETTSSCVLHDAGGITTSTPQRVSHGNELTQNYGTCLWYS